MKNHRMYPFYRRFPRKCLIYLGDWHLHIVYKTGRLTFCGTLVHYLIDASTLQNIFGKKSKIISSWEPKNRFCEVMLSNCIMNASSGWIAWGSNTICMEKIQMYSLSFQRKKTQPNPLLKVIYGKELINFNRIDPIIEITITRSIYHDRD